ncbi:MAG: hypothetical protein ABI091_20795 [Ferruginibacter sp.]
MTSFNFLLSGKKGMNKSIWAKVKGAQESILMSQINRDMGVWEACLIQLGTDKADDPLIQLTDLIGHTIIKKYLIEIE